jgi:hypothetical protein
MDLTKVYFKTEDENLKRLIVAVFLTKYSTKCNYKPFDLKNNNLMGYGPYFFIDGFGMVNSCGPKGYSLKNRTEASIEDLFKFAMNGWKEPWEVAEDGYRIATEQERRENAYPTDCKVRWCGIGNWKASIGDACWNPEGSQQSCKAFAVPEDYQFKKPEKEIEVNGKMYSESTIQNALREYVK